MTIPVTNLGPNSFRRAAPSPPFVEPPPIPALEAEITSAVTLMASHAVTDQIIEEHKRMNKLAEAAQRIKAKKAAHDAKGDEWLHRLDTLDAREPGAFAAGDAAISEREVDLSDMEATVRTLGNLGAVSGS